MRAAFALLVVSLALSGCDDPHRPARVCVAEGGFVGFGFGARPVRPCLRWRLVCTEPLALRQRADGVLICVLPEGMPHG